VGGVLFQVVALRVDYGYGLFGMNEYFTIEIPMQVSLDRRILVYFLAGCFARHRSRLIEENVFGVQRITKRGVTR